MNFCRDCVHWEVSADSKEDRNICSAAVMAFEEGNEDFAMNVNDGSAYYAELCTKGSHGCNEFKKRI